MASDRVYMSIGEVLALLKGEFPDVTISKIRFLESQGLLDPERTPSGYRKFYEADIERLRWNLRQQRENFLPLKVIRGRLARPRLQCGNCRAAAGGCHRASPMSKRNEAAAAVRPGPAAPFRLTALVVSAVHAPGPARPGRRCRLFSPADCGPGRPCSC